MMLYMSSTTRPDITFAIQEFARFKNNTKASHKMSVKRIYWYLQGTNDNGIVFNKSKKLMVDCYADADFSGLWGHKILKTIFLLGVELDLW